jgi:hypothetical protein
MPDAFAAAAKLLDATYSTSSTRHFRYSVSARFNTTG